MALLSVLVLTPAPSAAAGASDARIRIAVISSYNREYLWSQDTNAGVVAALREFGFLDDESQGARFTAEDHVENARVIVRKWWMDTKRRNSLAEIKQSVAGILPQLQAFAPNIVLLGDDNATNYIGNQLIDTDAPVVFWGVNGNPLKYMLLDSLERPGHNVTGVYQAGYMLEGVTWLTRLLPEVKSIAVLSDDSETGRTKAKELQRLSDRGSLPVTLVETVITDSLEQWKRRALELEPRVDAFFVLNHNTLKDTDGRTVDQMEVGAWYLDNIRKPDVGHEKQFVEEGMLCAIDDSGFKQGYEAVRIAHRILKGGESPAAIRVYAPTRGAFVVNLERARMLGLSQRVADSGLVESLVERAVARRHAAP